MTDIRIADDLWGASMTPEGVLEAWRQADGADVRAGTPLAEIRIEGAVHEVIASTSGRLAILAKPNALIEPGTMIGRIDPA